MVKHIVRFKSIHHICQCDELCFVINTGRAVPLANCLFWVYAYHRLGRLNVFYPEVPLSLPLLHLIGLEQTRMQWTIRQAIVDDAPVVAQYNINMAKETEGIDLNPETILKGCQAILERDDPSEVQGNPRGFYLVASLDNSIIGQLMITYEWSDWRNAVVWWIQSVYVVPEHRGKGVFASLYAHVKKMSKDCNAVGLRLYADTGNTNAQKTYRKLGMSSHYMVFEDLFD